MSKARFSDGLDKEEQNELMQKQVFQQQQELHRQQQIQFAKSNSFLKAQVKIGSCKGPVSYKAEQQVFHHDDVPAYARTRKEEVKEWAKSRIIPGDPSWKKSVKMEKPVCERRTRENHVKDRAGNYQYNFRAETLDPLKTLEPVDKPSKFHFSGQLDTTALDITQRMREGGPLERGQFKRTQEMPVNPKLEGAKSWNSSTYFTLKDRETSRADFTSTAVSACVKARTRYIRDPSEYVSPIQSTKLLQETVRAKKAEGTFEWKKLINRDAALDEPVDRRALVNRQAAEVSKAYFVSKHSGVWAYNEAAGRHMWSDTGSFEFDSPGDMLIRHDPDAYSFAGPTVPIRDFMVKRNGTR